MEYKILSKVTREDLEEEVNEYISEKWELQGGVTVGCDSDYDVYCQAMTRKDYKNDTNKGGTV